MCNANASIMLCRPHFDERKKTRINNFHLKFIHPTGNKQTHTHTTREYMYLYWDFLIFFWLYFNQICVKKNQQFIKRTENNRRVHHTQTTQKYAATAAAAITALLNKICNILKIEMPNRGKTAYSICVVTCFFWMISQNCALEIVVGCMSGCLFVWKSSTLV